MADDFGRQAVYDTIRVNSFTALPTAAGLNRIAAVQADGNSEPVYYKEGLTGWTRILDAADIPNTAARGACVFVSGAAQSIPSGVSTALDISNTVLLDSPIFTRVSATRLRANLPYPTRFNIFGTATYSAAGTGNTGASRILRVRTYRGGATAQTEIGLNGQTANASTVYGNKVVELQDQDDIELLFQHDTVSTLGPPANNPVPINVSCELSISQIANSPDQAVQTASAAAMSATGSASSAAISAATAQSAAGGVVNTTPQMLSRSNAASQTIAPSSGAQAVTPVWTDIDFPTAGDISGVEVTYNASTKSFRFSGASIGLPIRHSAQIGFAAAAQTNSGSIRRLRSIARNISNPTDIIVLCDDFQNATANSYDLATERIVPTGYELVFQASHNNYVTIGGAAASLNTTGAQASVASSAGLQGPAGPGYRATSTSSNAIGAGSKSFVTQAGLAFLPGQPVLAAADANNAMQGTVSSYTSVVGGTSTLVMNVPLAANARGSGTYANWTLGSFTPLDINVMHLTGDGVIASAIESAKTVKRFEAGAQFPAGANPNSEAIGTNVVITSGTNTAVGVGKNINVGREAIALGLNLLNNQFANGDFLIGGAISHPDVGSAPTSEFNSFRGTLGYNIINRSPISLLMGRSINCGLTGAGNLILASRSATQSSNPGGENIAILTGHNGDISGSSNVVLAPFPGPTVIGDTLALKNNQVQTFQNIIVLGPSAKATAQGQMCIAPIANSALETDFCWQQQFANQTGTAAVDQYRIHGSWAVNSTAYRGRYRVSVNDSAGLRETIRAESNGTTALTSIGGGTVSTNGAALKVYGDTELTGGMYLGARTIATLPSAAAYANLSLMVTNLRGFVDNAGTITRMPSGTTSRGYVISDGTNWLIAGTNIIASAT